MNSYIWVFVFIIIIIYVVICLFLHSFIYLLMDRILDRNPFENTLMRKMVGKFSFNTKDTSSINYDYRKFPLWQSII